MEQDKYNTSLVGQAMEVRRLPLSEQLKIEKQHLENRLAEVNRSIAVLEANPQVGEVIDVLSKNGHIHY